MRNCLPLAFLIGGTAAALYFAYESIFAIAGGSLLSAPVVECGIASLVAVLGWHELQTEIE